MFKAEIKYKNVDTWTIHHNVKDFEEFDGYFYLKKDSGGFVIINPTEIVEINMIKIESKDDSNS